MKKSILSMLFIVLSIAAFSQSEKYVSAMKANIALIDSAFKSPELFLKQANNFERIGNAEKTQWLPYYYAAYCQINYGFMQKNMDNMDELADKATVWLNKADSLMPNNSEISVLRSMVATAHMVVNPMQRYMQYGPEVQSALEDAMKQDANNPRPYLISGQNLQQTPAQFGGGCKTAKPILQTSLDKFATFKPASDISPNWGAAYAQTLISQCK